MNAPLRARTALSTALVGLLAGCSSLAATEHNIRELHDADGSPRAYNASVESDFGFAVGRLVESVFGGASTSIPADPDGGRDDAEIEDAAGVETRTHRLVDDPRRKARRELLELEAFSTTRPGVWPVQAELAAWLAVESTQPVERFVALRLVGRVARALGEVRPAAVGELLRAESGDPGAVAERDAEVSARLAVLLDELVAALAADDAATVRTALLAWPPSEQRLDATRRLLRLCSSLAGRAAGESRALLEQGARAYARHACALALEAALADPAPDVARLAATLSVELEPRRAFSLASTASQVGRLDVVEGVVRGLLATGLPADQDDGRALVAWLELLVDHLEGDSLTLAAPCAEALARFAPGDLETLRPEQWRARVAELRAALPPVESSGDGASGGGTSAAEGGA